MAITLATAEARLAAWVEADEVVSRSQSYTIDGRQMTRADAAEITAKIEYWERKVRQLNGTQRRGISRVNLND